MKIIDNYIIANREDKVFLVVPSQYFENIELKEKEVLFFGGNKIYCKEKFDILIHEEYSEYLKSIVENKRLYICISEFNGKISNYLNNIKIV